MKQRATAETASKFHILIISSKTF